jgi:hypothetical protein
LTSNLYKATTMKKLYILLPIFALMLAACSKRDYIPAQVNPRDWMRTHEHGVVAYVDYTTGNYIVETQSGFSVIEPWENLTPVEYDHEFANFSSRGIQTIYNQQGNYFTEGRVIDSWLSWDEALFILDDLRYNRY